MGPWKCGWAEKGRGQDVSGQGTARAVAMHYLLGMKTLPVADGVFWVKGRGWGRSSLLWQAGNRCMSKGLSSAFVV